SAVAPDAPARQVEALEIPLQEAEAVHGGHENGVGHALARRELEELARLELWHDDYAAARMPCRQEDRHHAGNVARRHREQRSVGRAEAQAVLKMQQRMHDVQVRE